MPVSPATTVYVVESATAAMNFRASSTETGASRIVMVAMLLREELADLTRLEQERNQSFTSERLRQ